MAGPVLRVVNWFNRPLLRWGIHPWAGSTLLLRVTGRRTGRSYDIPLWYITRGDTLIAFTKRCETWWRNLVGGAGVTGWLRGREFSGVARAVVNDPSEITPVLVEYLDWLRPPSAATYFGIRLDDRLRPADGEIERASNEEVVMIRVVLDA